MTQLYLDIETYSECDLNKAGTYAYAEHPSTRLVLFNYAFGVDAPVQCWAPVEQEPIPVDLWAALKDEQTTLVAHNAQFERVVLGHILHKCLYDPSRWRCTMALAHSLALPGGLEELCALLKISEDKAKLRDGKRLIRKFCTPDKHDNQQLPADHFDDWLRFLEYGHNDVTSLQQVAKKLGRWKLRPEDQALWELDQRINDRGWPVDMDLVDSALSVRELDETRAYERSKEISGLDNPNSRDQLLAFLRDAGTEVEDLTKATVSAALKRDDLPVEVRELLELRQGLSKTSIKKFQSLKNATCADRRIRGTLQFMGAGRTGRWSGRIFQPQNLASGIFEDPEDLPPAIDAVKTRDEELVRALYSDTPGVLSSLIRPAIRAPEGRTLVACDYASIETVMLAWAARCEHLLELIRGGFDPYKDYASARFDVAYDEVTKAQRKWAKPPTLGCGYMLGKDGLIAYAAGFGVQMEEEESQAAVSLYRNRYPEIVQFWWDLDRAARNTIKTGNSNRVGDFTFRMSGPFMQIVLPSGRALSYLHPKLEMRPTPWGEERLQITYMGRDVSRKLQRISTHPGKLTENIVQAISADLLAFGLQGAESEGVIAIGHVHDEIVAECDEDEGPETLGTLKQIMSRAPAWCANAPISADGWYGAFYRKD